MGKNDFFEFINAHTLKNKAVFQGQTGFYFQLARLTHARIFWDARMGQPHDLDKSNTLKSPAICRWFDIFQTWSLLEVVCWPPPSIAETPPTTPSRNRIAILYFWRNFVIALEIQPSLEVFSEITLASYIALWKAVMPNQTTLHANISYNFSK